MPARKKGKKVKRKTFVQGGKVYDARTLRPIFPVKVGKMTGSAVTESEKKRLKALAKINKMRPAGTGRKRK